MKTKLLSLAVLSAACVAGSAFAQTVTSSTPAPVQPAAAPEVATSVVNQTVYGQRLPSVDELSNAAAAQGLSVVRIEKSASQMTATYKYPDGRTNTVAYLLLPGAPGGPAQVVSPTSAPPAGYYESAPRVVYYEDYGPVYYGYPRYWYPPVSIGLGFGFHGGGYRGGFHGGFRH